MDTLPLFSDDYLLSLWGEDFAHYRESGRDEELRQRLLRWHERHPVRTERQLESQFIALFFKDIWGYWGTGEKDQASGFCLDAQYAVPGSGQGGGTGAADLALGWWGREDVPEVAQVLCEFKDIRSGLDAPQSRKGNNRSPVKQCFDYLKYEFDRTDANATVKPAWGVVTDMNEFRLYSRRVGDSQCQRFVIKAVDDTTSLIEKSEAGVLQRFFFATLLDRDMLLAGSGHSVLAHILSEQWVVERELERSFYRDYQGYREAVFSAIVEANPEFSGTRGQLVRLAQRFLDRCIFVLFCEDMGHALDFPTDLLRSLLVERSVDTYYDPQGDEIWSQVKRLFAAMRDGGVFPPTHKINRFNGGLFEELPELESLVIPNRVFCSRGQGIDVESLSAGKGTLLHLSAHYNFGAHGVEHERTITLYTLGRIFEQSITDLEYMEAEAEGKESVASLTKRKRDGVYYTPEWVTAYIVRETIGARLADIRTRLGFQYGRELPEDDVKAYQIAVAKQAKRKPKNAATGHMALLEAYEAELERLKVLDPACGSGAFLIQALQFLLAERQMIAEERARIAGTGTLFDNDATAREILANNLYGVDINPESVEITQLALWLHTASPGKALSNLENHIQCGNSLIGPDFEEFWQANNPAGLFDDLDAQAREDINVFDWGSAFPEVFGSGVPVSERGFDCVIGNPPYVKLQHFRKVNPDQSDYYLKQRRGDGPLYESAQTGNFDPYLLFIEKGLSLLSREGYMGYIAPNVWLKNEYGEGLRRAVKRQRTLDRWIDFQSHQVFEEATTYTALQFFRGQRTEAVRFALAPDGEISTVDWEGEVESAEWGLLPDSGAWNLMPQKDAALVARLRETCQPLSDVAAITVGIQTSADTIYHLHRVAPGRYRQQGGKADGVEYEIEDEIMHPLVSGAEVRRYARPETSTYLLFPYVSEHGQVRLLGADEIAQRAPGAWKYLLRHEKALRGRERGKMERDDGWWAYNYPKNLDKQETRKLLVPRLVTGLFCAADDAGEFYLDNVDVGGVMPYRDADLWYLSGILNAPVCDYVFRRISKPFRGNTLSANKQFIAPLPIPAASEQRKAEVGSLAKRLQVMHTQRRDTVDEMRRRLESPQCVDEVKEESWIWGDVESELIAREAPSELGGRELRSWTRTERAARLDRHMDAIMSEVRRGARLGVEEQLGEIRLLVDGIPLLVVYESADDAPFIAAQWRLLARSTNVTGGFQAKSLVKSLLRIRGTQNEALREQVINLDTRIAQLDVEIGHAEQEMNEYVYDLYELSEEEIRLIISG
jgi:hypothetical protein